VKLLDKSKKIFISPSAFKDSITSRGLTEFIKSYLWNRGFRNLNSFPGSDGGNGFLDSISTVYKGSFIQVDAPSLLRNGFHKENIFLIDDGRIAVIETASVIGIEKIPSANRNPFEYNSQPLGFLISKLKLKYPDITEFWIGIGGTATVDFGMGILEGLGFNFKTENGNRISPSLRNFNQIFSIETEKKYDFMLKFFYDVDNPVSEHKKSFFDIYGPQKGLGLEFINQIKQDFYEFSDRFNLSNSITGAGGALGLLPHKYLKTEFIKGTDFFFNNETFQNNLKESDVIITGEGKLDSQTFQGKWISGFLKYDQSVLCIAGKNESDFIFPSNWKIEELFKLEPDIQKSIRQAKVLIRQILDSNISE